MKDGPYRDARERHRLGFPCVLLEHVQDAPRPRQEVDDNYAIVCAVRKQPSIRRDVRPGSAIPEGDAKNGRAEEGALFSKRRREMRSRVIQVTQLYQLAHQGSGTDVLTNWKPTEREVRYRKIV